MVEPGAIVFPDLRVTTPLLSLTDLTALVFTPRACKANRGCRRHCRKQTRVQLSRNTSLHASVEYKTCQLLTDVAWRMATKASAALQCFCSGEGERGRKVVLERDSKLCTQQAEGLWNTRVSPLSPNTNTKKKKNRDNNGNCTHLVATSRDYNHFQYSRPLLTGQHLAVAAPCLLDWVRARHHTMHLRRDDAWEQHQGCWRAKSSRLGKWLTHACSCRSPLVCPLAMCQVFARHRSALLLGQDAALTISSTSTEQAP